MPHPSESTRIRHEYPTVDYRPSIDSYWIDARAHDYPGKTSGQYTFRDRNKALAKAENIAALVASVQTVTQHLPEAVIEKLNSLGLCQYDILSKALANALETKQQRKLGEAFEAFFKYKTSEGLRPLSLKIVIQEVSHFITAMGGKETDLSSINVSQINQYLLTHAHCAGTHNTKRKHICTFFSFCVTNDWLTKNPTHKVLIKPETIDVHVIQPKVIEALFDATFTQLPKPAAASMRAYLALAALAGVRPEEVHRLDWHDINVDQKLLYISKGKSKTNDDREVPLSDNCVAWLLTCTDRSGPITPKGSFKGRFNKIREHCGIRTWRKTGTPWHHDVLRHTFASSWLAIHKNRPLLAEIMGNSTRIITKHYKRTMPLEQAEALFAILPPEGIAAS